MLRNVSAPHHAFLAAALCLGTGCASREERITELSLSFMVKDGEDCFAAKCGKQGLRRWQELAKLARLGAFRKGMAPKELRRVLGEPTFIWDDVPDAVKQSDGFDVRYVYQLEVGLSLRAEFAEGALERAYWHDEQTSEPGGKRYPVRLVVRRVRARK